MERTFLAKGLKLKFRNSKKILHTFNKIFEISSRGTRVGAQITYIGKLPIFLALSHFFDEKCVLI